jgi:hypothetical protein
MATIVFGTYMVRYPLGGMLSNVLEYLVGFHRLGHDVVMVERSGYERSCFDPVRNVMTDDPTTGLAVVRDLLQRFEINQWCYVSADGRHYGLSEAELDDAFRRADLYVDYGAHGSWSEQAQTARSSALIDGEPGYRQIALEQGIDSTRTDVRYDFCFTNGHEIGLPTCLAPTAGFEWRHLFHPVSVDLHDGVSSPAEHAPFSTVMNWQSHGTIEYAGTTYGQKDVEFVKFQALPEVVREDVALEIAVAGPNVPQADLVRHGWRLRDAHEATRSYDSFIDYIDASAGEFTVCKNVFVALRTGWFSDRSAVYLARGRPVVMQDTGFSAHLPTGEGLFAVNTVDEAADALDAIAREPARHSAAAKDIAREYLAADRVLAKFLEETGTA